MSLQERGVLIEYALTPRPLVLLFQFNPHSITRSRTVSLPPGGLGKSATFTTQAETQRAAQGVSVKSETLSFTILLDATDRMNAGIDPLAKVVGVQPEIDVLNQMLQPKTSAPAGFTDLAIASGEKEAGSPQPLLPSVLLFKWGVSVLPVFLTQTRIETKAHLPITLAPYRAEASLTLEVIESENPIYTFERNRQEQSARSLGLVSGLASELLKF